MAHTIKVPTGQLTQGGGNSDVSATISGTEARHAFGPPSMGQGFMRGVYIKQVAGAAGTWRWLYDQMTPGVASPTTYAFQLDV
jgi:hypothetical protein